jgi:DNA primase catalytic core, N-terminal domain
MNPIQAAVQTLLPPNRKLTTGGWISFNAVCCHNRGDRPDSKKRGGVMFTDEGFTYHCFNCGFKAGWSPGKLFSANTKSLFKWLGMSDTEVSKLGLTILKFKEDLPAFKKPLNFILEERELPEGAMLLKDWALAVWKPGGEEDMVRVFEYLVSRGMDLDWYDWMWTPAPGYKDRLLIPFYQDGKVVGYTGRKITEGKPKYLTDSQNGYVFNIDRQTYQRSYVIVVEGQFDAIAIDGVGIMTNDPNETQCARINSLAREVIVVPDKDRPGAKLLKAAVVNNWSASMPPWDNDVKDVADAVKKYGRLYTLTTILHYKETNEIKIKMMQKKLEALLDE